jgi:hypothetical protein
MEIRDHEKLLSSGKDLSFLEAGVAFTGIVDGRVVCCGGVIPTLGGNSDIWIIPSVHVAQYTMTFARELRKALFNIRQDLALSRMQSACLNDELHDRWMSFLGFKKEGVMRKYFNGEDYAMWGRVWD